VDWTRVAAWSQLFYLLRTAGELTSGDFVETPTPAAQPVAQPVAGLESIENLDLSTREGRKLVEPILMRGMQQECFEWYSAFVDSIWKNFNYALTDDEVKAIVSVMRERNLNFTNAKDWDRARLTAIARGQVNPKLKYPAEILNQLIEETPLDSFTAKQELRRKERLLLNQ
jgi:hypothetical protein